MKITWVSKIFPIFLYWYILCILQLSYAADADNTKSNDLSQAVAKLHKKLQQFPEQKELSDINYDLYRIVNGSNVDNRVIEAQDPKGYLLKKHNEMFCSVQDDKKCSVNSALYTYGDMKASLLLQNFYQSQEEINLATEVMRNIINPFPSNIALDMREASIRDRELPEKKAALAQAFASQARLGVVRNSFNTMLGNRLPLDLLEGKMSDSKKNFSILSIMEQEATDRFENTKWHELIDKGNQDLFLKELAKIEAFKIWMDYHKYKQNERIEALLATMVAQQENLNQLLTDKNAKKN